MAQSTDPPMKNGVIAKFKISESEFAANKKLVIDDWKSLFLKAPQYGGNLRVSIMVQNKFPGLELLEAVKNLTYPQPGYQKLIFRIQIQNFE